MKSPSPTWTRAGGPFLEVGDRAAIVPGWLFLARLPSRRNPPQRVFPFTLSPPAVTRAFFMGGMGGVVRLPPDSCTSGVEVDSIDR